MRGATPPTSARTAPATKNVAPCHTWNVIYNARSNMCHCPNSPNTAPATKNESHDCSLSHMKRYIYIAQSNMCHSRNSPNTAPATKNDRPKSQRNLLKTAETSFTMRGWSERPRLLFTPTASSLYWKIQHFALRLSFQISPNAAPAAKSDTWTSPSTAPATQNNSHDQSSSHRKRYLQCADSQVSLSKLTKYCACHEK